MIAVKNKQILVFMNNHMYYTKTTVMFDCFDTHVAVLKDGLKFPAMSLVGKKFYFTNTASITQFL